MKKKKKIVRCPELNKNVWIELVFEENVNNEEIIICMTCKKKDRLEAEGRNCDVACKNYFYSY